MNMDSNPPLFDTYKSLFDRQQPDRRHRSATAAEECELPVVDLSHLKSKGLVDRCKREIVTASSEWGFFQVVNHGIPAEVLERMRAFMVDAFRQPFETKAGEMIRPPDLSPDSYRWGTPTATSLRQLSWSEAYHIALSPAPRQEKQSTIEEFTAALSRLAQQLAAILAEGMGCEGAYFEDSCTCDTCFLRLNHYPPCPIADGVLGLIPHTDSDFMTVLFQDQVGGLQLKKDGRWITVKPNPNALIVNIGDLFQAWSNGVYKSVEHRVVSNPKLERYSVAYFLCPSYDSMIQSHAEPSVYRNFTFREYRQQVQEDVKLTGHKVGLPRFLA